jgi:glycosyltransferase involved in cell wall biosynthesis
MASGCAVVSTDNGGVPAFAGSAVEVVPRNSSIELIGAAVRLLDDVEGLDRLGELSLARAKEMSAAESCERFEQFLHKVVTTHGPD